MNVWDLDDVRRSGILNHAVRCIRTLTFILSSQGEETLSNAQLSLVGEERDLLGVVLYWLDSFAVARGLAYVDCYLVGFGDAARYFYHLAVVIAEGYFGQVQLVVAYDRDVDFAVAEYQRVVGHGRRPFARRDHEFSGSRTYLGRATSFSFGRSTSTSIVRVSGESASGWRVMVPVKFLPGIAGCSNRRCVTIA